MTLYEHGLVMGGPAEMAFGWPLVTLFTLAVALSMAELASSLPTSGHDVSLGLAGSAARAGAGSPRGSTSRDSSPRLPASTTAARCSSRRCLAGR